MKISDKVWRTLQAEQISEEELVYMLKHAAICTLRDCNRRYFHWVFRVDGTVLHSMERQTQIVVGRGSGTVAEDHDACNGEGCHVCGWIGTILRRVSDATEEHLTNMH